jgi:hypothetical protein
MSLVICLPGRSPNVHPMRAILACVSAALLAGCAPGEAPAPPSAASSAMGSELARAAERGNMCSAREAKAAGLKAEFFAQPRWAGTALLSRLEGPVEASSAGAADAAEPVQARSARWRGWIRPPLTGAYAFHSNQPGVRITVSGQPVSSGPDSAGATVQLAAGRYHPIIVEWADIPSAARSPQTRSSADAATAAPAAKGLTLSWTAPHGARYVIPKSALYPPTDTVADGPKPVAAVMPPAMR